MPHRSTGPRSQEPFRLDVSDDAEAFRHHARKASRLKPLPTTKRQREDGDRSPRPLSHPRPLAPTNVTTPRPCPCETLPMTELSIHDWPLPYEPRLAARMSTDIDLVVIHCTELPDLATAREYGERIRYAETQTGNSGHYYIDRDGAPHRSSATCAWPTTRSATTRARSASSWSISGAIRTGTMHGTSIMTEAVPGQRRSTPCSPCCVAVARALAEPALDRRAR